jgi:hypothetical protein
VVCGAQIDFEGMRKKTAKENETMTIAYTNSGALEKNGSGAFCFKVLDTFFVSGRTHSPFTVSQTVRNLGRRL